MKKILATIALVLALAAIGVATQVVLGPASYAGDPAPSSGG